MLSMLSRWLIQYCLYLDFTSCIPEISSSFLMTSLLILSNLVYQEEIHLIITGFLKFIISVRGGHYDYSL